MGAALPHTLIRKLDLSDNGLGDEGAIGLAGALRKAGSLKWLALRGNRIGAAGAWAILQARAVKQSLEVVGLPIGPVL